jgi:hypothetical protein
MAYTLYPLQKHAFYFVSVYLYIFENYYAFNLWKVIKEVSLWLP